MSNVLTPIFRVSYPNVFKARLNDQNGKMEFSVAALFKKGENLDKLKAAAQAAIIEKWGADKAKWPKNLRSPFRDQGEREYENDEGKMVMPQGMEKGAIFMNFKSQQKPGVVNEKVEDMINESEFYAGCFARATVRCFAYSQKGNNGVSFGLQNIQKVGEGEPLGSRTKAQDDFAPIEASNAGESAIDTGDIFAQ